MPDDAASRLRASLLPVPAQRFTMGTDDPRGYAADGEGPEHPVEVSAFAVAPYAVTNAWFARFVEETGHVTTAERFGNSFVFAGLLPDDAPPTQGVVGTPWWRLVEGASWRAPEGPWSDVRDRPDHPVVHVSWLDAVAFCAWSGTRLPTEAEWECAARGGLAGQHYPWGAEREPGGEHRMNVFQGTFPGGDTGEDGWVGTAPVGSFPANGYGLHDVTGNVWEWCADWFDPEWYARSAAAGVAVDPTGPAGPVTGARVMRGGSYLCHDSYCWRYRVDARSSNTPDSTTGNLGFRVAGAAAVRD
ncbi:formylglycine-generating enzyme family protein [Nocardioides sp. YIM 152588]|uniref:formylglycine-generating enzyme family protein n=1 Tax=Nocardioides sp. YIM 152588 TaxID=3158259 RepID=UPI0032E38CB7